MRISVIHTGPVFCETPGFNTLLIKVAIFTGFNNLLQDYVTSEYQPIDIQKNNKIHAIQ